MESKILEYAGNSVKIQFDIRSAGHQGPGAAPHMTYNSSQFICSTVAFEVKAKINRVAHSFHTKDYWDVLLSVFLKFSKTLKDDLVLYNCKIISATTTHSYMFSTSDQIWHQISDMCVNSRRISDPIAESFDVTVKIDVVNGNGAFASMYDDSDLTDFKMCGIDGSVPVHSAILAGFSPVLKTMLSGEWKEVAEGKIDVANTTKETLEHFKEYIYLDKLPEEGIEQLLVLGSYYMIPDLVIKCTAKLLCTLSVENLCELIEFAAKYKVNKLLVAILAVVKNGGLEIRE